MPVNHTARQAKLDADFSGFEDEHLDETTRSSQPRHSLVYLQALAETGDLEALLPFYTAAAPGRG